MLSKFLWQPRQSSVQTRAWFCFTIASYRAVVRCGPSNLLTSRVSCWVYFSFSNTSASSEPFPTSVWVPVACALGGCGEIAVHDGDAPQHVQAFYYQHFTSHIFDTPCITRVLHCFLENHRGSAPSTGVPHKPTGPASRMLSDRYLQMHPCSCNGFLHESYEVLATASTCHKTAM